MIQPSHLARKPEAPDQSMLPSHRNTPRNRRLSAKRVVNRWNWSEKLDGHSMNDDANWPPKRIDRPNSEPQSP